jgi:hypothetical protein
MAYYIDRCKKFFKGWKTKIKRTILISLWDSINHIYFFTNTQFEVIQGYKIAVFYISICNSERNR